MKSIAAYFIAFLLGPTVGALASLLFFPLLPVFSKMRIYPAFRGLTGVISGFVAVWFAGVVFSWFGIRIGLLMVLILGAGFVLNDLRRVIHATPPILSNEIMGAIGDLAGVAAGGFYFL